MKILAVKVVEGKCFYLGKNNYYELRKNVLRELADGFSCIHDNFKYFKTLNKNKIKVIGAAEWLLDNIYLIEKEYKCVKKCMPLDYFKSLPYGKDYLKYIEINHDDLNSSKNRTNDWDKSSIIDFNINKNTDSSLDKDNNNSINNISSSNVSSKEDSLDNNVDDNNNVPRIFILAKKYINEKRNIEINSLIHYIRHYEEIEENKKRIDYCFTMGELWAFPLMLRTAVILNLSHYTNELVKVQKDILRGKQYAEKVIDCINKEKLSEKFDFNDDYFTNDSTKLSPLFLREFARVMRENSIEDSEISNYSKLNWNIDMDYNNFSIKANLKEEALEPNIGE